MERVEAVTPTLAGIIPSQTVLLSIFHERFRARYHLGLQLVHGEVELLHVLLALDRSKRNPHVVDHSFSLLDHPVDLIVFNVTVHRLEERVDTQQLTVLIPRAHAQRTRAVEPVLIPQRFPSLVPSHRGVRVRYRELVALLHGLNRADSHGCGADAPGRALRHERPTAVGHARVVEPREGFVHRPGDARDPGVSMTAGH